MKVSIITANRDCANHLPGCVESVSIQNYSNLEHLIMDDCSYDNSPRVLRRLARRYPQLKVFATRKRMRCGTAYATISKKATGDIVCVLDSDDALAPDAVSTIVDLYEKYPDVGYIYTQHTRCNHNLRKNKKGCSRHPGKGSLLDAGSEGKHCFSHWRTVRRSVMEKGEIFQEGLKSAVDKYMGYALEELTVGGFADVPLYFYRQRITCLTTTYGRRNWLRMKRKMRLKRSEQKTKVYPIICLDV